jgi:hypothetical protein
MAERGYYGYAQSTPAFSSITAENPDYSGLGTVLGVGALLGIMIGSNITFHTPIRKRRR